MASFGRESSTGGRGFQPSRSRFLCSAANSSQAPETGLPEIAITGRSNVGKSSLVNFLLGRRHLARTSSTPGRTQTLNFFQVDDRLVLADLPGYGYARAPRTEVSRWSAAVRAYVAHRACLEAVILLLDIRRDPSPEDVAFAALVRSERRRLLPVLTKADKVARGRRSGRVAAVSTALGLCPGDLIVTSVREREGRAALWTRILGVVDAKAPCACPAAPGKRPRVVAIDGPSGAGKSTVARQLATRLRWNYIDTGAMYRSVGLKADRRGVALDDDRALESLCQETSLELGRLPDGALRVLLDGEDVSDAIREHRVSDLASRVSARQPVRAAMARFQRQLGCAAPSVLEGRDIGTVVFPDALVKVFLTASVEERADRRAKELAGRGQEVGHEQVLRDMRLRDANDSSREHAPLRPGDDAQIIDTTGLSVAEVVDRIALMVADALGRDDRP